MTDVDVSDSLTRFIESSNSDSMPELASELLDLLETDAVEPLSTPGRPIAAEEVAERLEQRVDKIRRRMDNITGLDLIEEVVGHLRAHEVEMISPWTYEDGDGIRWFVLASESDVVACYTNRPFVAAEM